MWDANRLRIATDAAGVALWSWNVDADEIALDELAHRLWGLPANSGLVTFEDLSARIHPEDLDRVSAAFTATRDISGLVETMAMAIAACWQSMRVGLKLPRGLPTFDPAVLPHGIFEQGNLVISFLR